MEGKEGEEGGQGEGRRGGEGEEGRRWRNREELEAEGWQAVVQRNRGQPLSPGTPLLLAPQPPLISALGVCVSTV